MTPREKYKYISCLPVEYYMKYYVDTPDGREENDNKKIEPIIGVDGWFYNRKLKFEWFEYKCEAYGLKSNGSQFKYQMFLHNVKILTRREVEAYTEVLRLKPSKQMARQILNLLSANSEVSNLRNIKVDGRLRLLRFKKTWAKNKLDSTK